MAGRTRCHGRGRVALVTGCSAGGIGYALSHELARHGCRVFATARRLGLTQGLEQVGCTCLELDVTDAQQLAHVVDHVLAEAGHIDILINNAGSMMKCWAIETPLQDVRNLMEVNFFAVLAVTQAVAPHMVRRRRGTIVNVSSSCTWLSVPQASAYSASKFAVRGYTDALRVELAPLGVRVMHVVPGFVKTNIFRSNTSLELRQDSAYSGFTHANKLLVGNDLEHGPGAWHPTDPAAFAASLAPVVLARNPPAVWHGGWLWRAAWWLGNFAPLWCLDYLHQLRLRLFAVCAT